MLRVFVADEHEVVRHGLRINVESQKDWQVVAEAADGKEAIETAIETKPDVAVIAYELPVVNGIDVTARIREQLPDTEVVIHTGRKVEHLLGDLLNAGARGIVFKSDPVRHVIDAIKTVASRKLYFRDMESLQRILQDRNETGLSLTPRERSVVQLIAEGYTNKEAARLLGIGVKTVETHRLSAMNKLELVTSADLVRYAVRNHIIEA